MQIKKKLNNLIKLYIIFFSYVLFINIIFSTTLNANTFKVTNLEVSEPFDLNFNKKKVIDKGFRQAFDELVSMITTSDDKQIIKNTSLTTIKRLIDSFTMSDEKFVNNTYQVKFDVNFNKKNTLNFFEQKNIFPSIPQIKKILLIPVLVDLSEDKILLFNNIFYKNWNSSNAKYFLLKYLLPSEDLEDVNLLMQNIRSIENYDFEDTIKKYDLNDYIITIIYKDKNELRILSKIQLNNFLKIDNQKFKDIDLSNDKDFELVLNNLKIIYENHWKKINQINTSIKLPLTISVDAKKHKKIEILENTLNELDLVSNYEFLKFNNENILLRVIYNGAPNKFITDMKQKNIMIDNHDQVWVVQ